MDPFKISIDLKFDWPDYEINIQQVIKQVILEEVGKEARTFAKGLREAIRKHMIKHQEELVTKTLYHLNKKGMI